VPDAVQDRRLSSPGMRGTWVPSLPSASPGEVRVGQSIRTSPTARSGDFGRGRAAQLRRIALHEETAALLEVRATRARTDDLASPLERRAAQHRREAQRLRAELLTRAESERRRSGEVIADSATATR
jgi:hypothetical protein